VVAPEVPGSRSIRQAVFDHEAHGQADDALGVMAPRGGEVGKVGAEIDAATHAAVLGVNDVQITGAVPAQAAEVMEDTAAQGVAVATTAAARAGTPAVAARAVFDQGRGQVFDTDDPCGAVRDIIAGWHGLLSRAR
jgi:hypothetical protein